MDLFVERYQIHAKLAGLIGIRAMLDAAFRMLHTVPRDAS